MGFPSEVVGYSFKRVSTMPLNLFLKRMGWSGAPSRGAGAATAVVVGGGLEHSAAMCWYFQSSYSFSERAQSGGTNGCMQSGIKHHSSGGTSTRCGAPSLSGEAGAPSGGGAGTTVMLLRGLGGGSGSGPGGSGPCGCRSTSISNRTQGGRGQASSLRSLYQVRPRDLGGLGFTLQAALPPRVGDPARW